MRILSFLVLVVLFGCKQDPTAMQRNLGGISSGGTFAVGLPAETGLFIQEYWHQGQPHYLAYNHNDRPLEVTIHQLFVTTPSSSSHLDVTKGAHLAGPWFLNAKSAAHFEIQKFLAEDAETFLGFFFDALESMGALSPPRPSEASLFPSNSYASIDGLNGIGGRKPTSWTELDSLQVLSDQEFNMTLKLTGDFISVQFRKTFAGDSLPIPALEVLSAISSDLRIEDRGDEIFIFKEFFPSNDVGSVTLRLKAPHVTSPIMAYQMGFRCEHLQDAECATGHSLPRGVFVIP